MVGHLQCVYHERGVCRQQLSGHAGWWFSRKGCALPRFPVPFGGQGIYRWSCVGQSPRCYRPKPFAVVSSTYSTERVTNSDAVFTSPIFQPYLANLKAGSTDGKGRGLFTTSLLQAGTLLLVSKPVAMAWCPLDQLPRRVDIKQSMDEQELEGLTNRFTELQSQLRRKRLTLREVEWLEALLLAAQAAQAAPSVSRRKNVTLPHISLLHSKDDSEAALSLPSALATDGDLLADFVQVNALEPDVSEDVDIFWSHAARAGELAPVLLGGGGRASEYARQQPSTVVGDGDGNGDPYGDTYGDDDYSYDDFADYSDGASYKAFTGGSGGDLLREFPGVNPASTAAAPPLGAKDTQQRSSAVGAAATSAQQEEPVRMPSPSSTFFFTAASFPAATSDSSTSSSSASSASSSAASPSGSPSGPPALSMENAEATQEAWSSSTGSTVASSASRNTSNSIEDTSSSSSSSSSMDAVGLSGGLQAPPRAFPLGLWPEACLLNHSCQPCTTSYVVRDRLVVRCTRSLPPSVELTTSYLRSGSPESAIGLKGAGLGALFAPRRVRRELLESGWGFRCNCQRCKTEDRLAPDLQAAITKAYDAAQVLQADLGAAQAEGGEGEEALRGVVQQLEVEVQELHSVMSRHHLSHSERMVVQAGCLDLYVALWKALRSGSATPAAVGAAPVGLANTASAGAALPELITEVCASIAPGSRAHLDWAATYLFATWEAQAAQEQEQQQQQQASAMPASALDSGDAGDGSSSSSRLNSPAVQVADRAAQVAYSTRYGSITRPLYRSLLKARARREGWL